MDLKDFMKKFNPFYVYKRLELIQPYFSTKYGLCLQEIQKLLFLKGIYTSKNQKRLLSLKDKYEGQRCFILGNGPSINKQDLSLLRNEHVFVTNWFVLHEEFKNFQNCFYCASDPHLWNYSKGFNKKLVEMLKQNEKAKYFFIYLAYGAFKRESRWKCSEPYFIRVSHYKRVWDGNFSTNVEVETYIGNTVIIDLCIPLAFFLGFREIYLMGCDFRFKEDKQSHFFKRSTIPEDNLKLLEQKDRFRLENIHDIVNASYSVVKEYADNHGRVIYNAGYGGRLEIFGRVNYEELMKNKL